MPDEAEAERKALAALKRERQKLERELESAREIIVRAREKATADAHAEREKFIADAKRQAEDYIKRLRTTIERLETAYLVAQRRTAEAESKALLVALPVDDVELASLKADLQAQIARITPIESPRRRDLLAEIADLDRKRGGLAGELEKFEKECQARRDAITLERDKMRAAVLAERDKVLAAADYEAKTIKRAAENYIVRLEDRKTQAERQADEAKARLAEEEGRHGRMVSTVLAAETELVRLKQEQASAQNAIGELVNRAKQIAARFAVGALAAFMLWPGQAEAAYEFDAPITCETTATTGTGTVTLGGALSGGYLSFATTVTSGNTVPYSIIEGAGATRKLEVGNGVFTDGASDTLTRVADWSSDGVGAELNLGVGTKTVCVGLNASMFNTGVADFSFSTLTVSAAGLQIDDTNASHQLILTPGSNLTADRVLTLTTGDAARTLTLSANATLNDTDYGDITTSSSFTAWDIDADAVGPTELANAGDYDLTGTLTLDSDALQLDDTNASHQLILTPGSDLTADRVLTLTTGDAARTLTISANATLNDADYGDITTSSSFTAWNIDSGVVGAAELDETANFAFTGNNSFDTGTLDILNNLRFPDAEGINDDSGNEQIRFQKTASAVNQFDVTNSATGGVQRIEATGDDAAIAVTIASKSTDPVNIEINGATEVSTDASSTSPGTNDGNALGTTSLGWADLHLATGGVINFDGGDVTLTHSANLLTFAGASSSSGYSFDSGLLVSSSTPSIIFTDTDDGADARIIASDTDGSLVIEADFNNEISSTEIEFKINGSGKWEISESNQLRPSVDNQQDIGTTSLGVNNMHFDSGAIINFENGDVTITHATNLVTIAGGRVAYAAQGELTIATGAVTATGTNHTIDTEADAASDDLDTINGGADGVILFVRAVNDARSVVLKDGTGNIQGPGDCTLDNTQDIAHLIFDSTLNAWLVVACGNNGA